MPTKEGVRSEEGAGNDGVGDDIPSTLTLIYTITKASSIATQPLDVQFGTW